MPICVSVGRSPARATTIATSSYSPPPPGGCRRLRDARNADEGRFTIEGSTLWPELDDVVATSQVLEATVDAHAAEVAGAVGALASVIVDEAKFIRSAL